MRLTLLWLNGVALRGGIRSPDRACMAVVVMEIDNDCGTWFTPKPKTMWTGTLEKARALPRYMRKAIKYQRFTALLNLYII